MIIAAYVGNVIGFKKYLREEKEKALSAAATADKEQKKINSIKL